VAECRDLHCPPAFGSFVRVAPFAHQSDAPDPFVQSDLRDRAIYAIVMDSRTGARESGRRPTAYGLDAETLRREQPQVFELLATEFSALVIGFIASGRFRGVLPPQPARLHDRVEPCSEDEVVRVSEDLAFVRGVIGHPSPVAQDELVAAAIRSAAEPRADRADYLVRAGKMVARLLQRDYGRVEAILSKLDV
jgi:hypothetical protein